LCDQVGWSVCVQARAKSYAWIYMKFFLSKAGLAQSEGEFIFEVIWIDLHYH